MSTQYVIGDAEEEHGIVSELWRMQEELSRTPELSGESLSYYMTRFWSLIASTTDDQWIVEFESSENFAYLQQFFRPYWSRYIDVLERDQRRRITPFGVRPQLRSTPSALKKVGGFAIEKELALLRGRHYRKLVVVGFGPYPESFISICGRGVRIDHAVGIDSRTDVQRHAQMVLDEMQPLPIQSAQLVCASGRDFDYQGADLVLLANALQGKQDVLSRVVATALPNVQILVRQPVRLGSLLYEKIDMNVIEAPFKEVDYVLPSSLSKTSLIAAS